MEDNIRLVKEFSHTPQVLRQGIRAYQNKFVFPRAFIRILGYLIVEIGLVACILFVNLGERLKLMCYLAFVAIIALMFRELFVPMKQRDNIVQSMELNEENPLYRLTVSEKAVEISMLNEAAAQENGEEAAPPTIIPIDDKLSVIEREQCFVLVCSDYAYYIIPKADFSPEELEIIRNISN